MSTEREEQEIQKLEEREHAIVREEEALQLKEKELHREIEELKRRENAEFGITVNNNSVIIHGHEHTGLEIKAAAIKAGVLIQLDFVLSEELSHNRSRIIGDDQRIHIDAGACFEAIPNDDHS